PSRQGRLCRRPRGSHHRFPLRDRGGLMTSRWGDADEGGARNLVDAAATLRGLASVRTGEVVPMALPIESGKPAPGMARRMVPQHFMLRDGGDYAAGLAERDGLGFSDDVIMLATHGG